MTTSAGEYSETFGAEFQTHILAVLARTPTAIGRYRSALNPAYFDSDVVRVIAKALLTHYDKNHLLPTKVTLVEEVRPLAGEDKFDACEKLVRKLYDSDISDAEAVLKKAVEFGREQAMVNAIIEGAEFVRTKKRGEIIPLIQKAQLVGEDLLNVGIEYADSADVRANWYKHDDNEKIPTGVYHLDYALGGGLGRGELGVILAPPKRGKSITLVNFGFGALTNMRGLNVAHYSHEMYQVKIAVRYDDRLAGDLISMKKKDTAEYVRRLNELSEQTIRGRLFIRDHPTRTCTVSMLRSHLSMLAGRGFKPDLVIVDYADIMKPERRIGDMRHEQAGIYEDLRALAGDFKCALWTASQAPRGALEKETLNMGDFAEAFEKAAVMDVGIGFSETPDERLENECRLFLMGVRDSEDQRTVKCKVFRDRCTIVSTRLLDSALTPVETPGDLDPAFMDEAKAEATPKETVEKLKRAVGIKKVVPQTTGARKIFIRKPSKKVRLVRPSTKVTPQ